MLMYVAATADHRGTTVHRHSWSEPKPSYLDPKIEPWVRTEITPLLETVGGAPLLIAKSLGTNAAAVAAERSLPAIWLTPVFTTPWIPAALSRATAPFLLVGGTADAMWDSTAAHRLSPHVLEIEAADHGLFVPGPIQNSIAVLGRVVTAIQEFLDTINWPGHTDSP
jgi:pimeloyl-ACP methyl ester carboxylesterase